MPPTCLFYANSLKMFSLLVIAGAICGSCSSGAVAYFRKRLTLEIPGEINEMILSTAGSENENDDHKDTGSGGTMIAGFCFNGTPQR